MTFLGIDLHSNRFTCCYLNDADSKRVTRSLGIDASSMQRFYKSLDQETYVILEASTNTFNFIDLI